MDQFPLVDALRAAVLSNAFSPKSCRTDDRRETVCTEAPLPASEILSRRNVVRCQLEIVFFSSSVFKAAAFAFVFNARVVEDLLLHGLIRSMAYQKRFPR